MSIVHRRWEDQDGFWAKVKWILCHPAIQGAIGALLVGFIFWLSNFFQSMPLTYAQKSEMSNLAIKHDLDYKYLDERKMNKEDYIREHTALRQDMNDGFKKLAESDDKVLNILLQVRASQLVQYKKISKEE